MNQECLKVVKIYQTHSHNLYFRITGLELNNRKILPDPDPFIDYAKAYDRVDHNKVSCSEDSFSFLKTFWLILIS